MNRDEKIALWDARWTLVAGMVVCTGCLQGQRLSQSGDPFLHESGCRRAEIAGSSPWMNLRDIFDAERGSNAVKPTSSIRRTYYKDRVDVL